MIKKCKTWPGKLLEEVSAEIDAPAFLQEQTYGQVIGKSLKRLDMMRARQEKAKELPHNQLSADLAPDTSVLMDAYSYKGAVVDDKT